MMLHLGAMAKRLACHTCDSRRRSPSPSWPAPPAHMPPPAKALASCTTPEPSCASEASKLRCRRPRRRRIARFCGSGVRGACSKPPFSGCQRPCPAVAQDSHRLGHKQVRSSTGKRFDVQGEAPQRRRHLGQRTVHCKGHCPRCAAALPAAVHWAAAGACSCYERLHACKQEESTTESSVLKHILCL